MNRRYLRRAAWGCVVGLVLLAAGCRNESARDDPPQSSAPSRVATLGTAPDFRLETMEGGTFALSDHRGKVVVINFWATWCAPCLEEIPGFIRLQNEFRERGLQILGVSLDTEGFNVVRPFAELLGINYPLVVNDGVVAETYRGHFVVPTTFVVDRRGEIRGRYIGIVTFSELEPLLEELLSESKQQS